MQEPLKHTQPNCGHVEVPGTTQGGVFHCTCSPDSRLTNLLSDISVIGHPCNAPRTLCMAMLDCGKKRQHQWCPVSAETLKCTGDIADYRAYVCSCQALPQPPKNSHPDAVSTASWTTHEKLPNLREFFGSSAVRSPEFCRFSGSFTFLQGVFWEFLLRNSWQTPNKLPDSVLPHRTPQKLLGVLPWYFGSWNGGSRLPVSCSHVVM